MLPCYAKEKDTPKTWPPDWDGPAFLVLHFQGQTIRVPCLDAFFLQQGKRSWDPARGDAAEGLEAGSSPGLLPPHRPLKAACRRSPSRFNAILSVDISCKL